MKTFEQIHEEYRTAVDAWKDCDNDKCEEAFNTMHQARLAVRSAVTSDVIARLKEKHSEAFDAWMRSDDETDGTRQALDCATTQLNDAKFEKYTVDADHAEARVTTEKLLAARNDIARVCAELTPDQAYCIAPCKDGSLTGWVTEAGRATDRYYIIFPAKAREIRINREIAAFRTVSGI